MCVSSQSGNVTCTHFAAWLVLLYLQFIKMETYGMFRAVLAVTVLLLIQQCINKVFLFLSDTVKRRGWAQYLWDAQTMHNLTGPASTPLCCFLLSSPQTTLCCFKTSKSKVFYHPILSHHIPYAAPPQDGLWACAQRKPSEWVYMGFQLDCWRTPQPFSIRMEYSRMGDRFILIKVFKWVILCLSG